MPIQREPFGFGTDPASMAWGVGCEKESDAQRLRELGCRPEVIQVVGSMMFDAAKLDELMSYFDDFDPSFAIVEPRRAR